MPGHDTQTHLKPFLRQMRQKQKKAQTERINENRELLVWSGLICELENHFLISMPSLASNIRLNIGLTI